MKQKTSAKKPRASRPPSEAQLKALRDSTAARRQATIERLRSAIDALTAKKQKISTQTIYEECGLRYAAIHRNREAYALFRAHSTHLVAHKKRERRKPTNPDEGKLAPRDPLLNYKKPQLVKRCRADEQRIQELEQQVALNADEALKKEARIAELEAKIAQLEPYHLYVEQLRAQMQREEQGRFGDPPGV